MNHSKKTAALGIPALAALLLGSACNAGDDATCIGTTDGPACAGTGETPAEPPVATAADLIWAFTNVVAQNKGGIAAAYAGPQAHEFGADTLWGNVEKVYYWNFDCGPLDLAIINVHDSAETQVLQLFYPRESDQFNEEGLQPLVQACDIHTGGSLDGVMVLLNPDLGSDPLRWVVGAGDAAKRCARRVARGDRFSYQLWVRKDPEAAVAPAPRYGDFIDLTPQNPCNAVYD